MMEAATLRIVGLEDWARFEHAAMASSFAFYLRGAAGIDVGQLRSAAQEAFQLIDQIEEQLSFYRESSDVSRINRAQEGDTLRVNESTLVCLLTALEVASASGGAFDPFAGEAALAAKNQKPPPHLVDVPAEDPPGTPCVAFDPESGQITKLAGRRWLDLGGVGKGYALDAAAELLQSWDVQSGLLIAGGSSIAAFGPGPDESGQWVIELDNADGPRRLTLAAPFGLGASGEGFQPGHIIRPPEEPTEAPRRTYALASTAALADALSTALWAIPAAQRTTLAQAWPDVSVLIEPRRPARTPPPAPEATGTFAATPAAHPDCLLVIPCWREARRLPRFLPELCAAVSESRHAIEIVVVDDGSEPREAEATAAVVDAQRHQHPHLRPLIRATPHLGKGAAILRGWREVPPNCTWLAFVDADGSVSGPEVVRLIDLAIAQGDANQVIAASRRHRDPTRPVQRAARRAWVGDFFARWSRWRLRHEADDPQCGCKVIPASLYRAHPWSQTGYALDLELLLSAQQLGYIVQNVPIAWHETPGSKLRASDLFSMLQCVERLRITARAFPRAPSASNSSTPP
jgi:thiamine biosynthesis lipoprotein ApbE